MAKRNGLGFLGRVPIDTVLVGLLDAVSKGEIPAAGLSVPPASNGDSGSVGNGNGNGSTGTHTNGADSPVSFPLLDRYLETTSARVWKEITAGVVRGIESRKEEIQSRLNPVPTIITSS